MHQQISNQKYGVFPTYMQSVHYGVMAAAFFVAMVFVDSVPRYASLTSMRSGDLLVHGVATMFLTALVYFSIADSPVRRALKALLAVAVMVALQEAAHVFVFHGAFDGTGFLTGVIAAATCVLILNLLQTFRVARTKK
jgi:hypothetical protein